MGGSADNSFKAKHMQNFFARSSAVYTYSQEPNCDLVHLQSHAASPCRGASSKCICNVASMPFGFTPSASFSCKPSVMCKLSTHPAATSASATRAGSSGCSVFSSCAACTQGLLIRPARLQDSVSTAAAAQPPSACLLQSRKSARQVQVRIGQQLKDLGQKGDALPSILAGKPAASVQLPELIRGVRADPACIIVAVQWYITSHEGVLHLNIYI